MADQPVRESGIPPGEGGGKFVLYAALAANLGIAVAKFVAAGMTGSSAMLTEGFHSCVDSANQLLLLYGQHRSKKPADRLHPLGYGRELYFWSFVVAILIFATGAGLSIYEGILHILDPEQIGDPIVNYVVLGISIALEGTSWFFAMREFRKTQGDQTIWAAIRDSKDPPTFIVLFEDTAALIGLLIAAGGITLSIVTGNAVWDGAASIAIGLVLAAVATVLARESKDLLIGERADDEFVRAVTGIVERRPEVTRVTDVVTIQMAPEAIFVGMDVDFVDDVPAGRIERMIAEVEAELACSQPKLHAIYLKPKAGSPADAAGTAPSGGG